MEDPFQQIEGALQELANAGVTRETLDPDTGEQAWMLHHDYLAQPIAEAERRANQWQVLLEEGNRSFEQAGNNLFRRWRALLGMRSQLRLWMARAASRFRYGDHSAYALWSLVRFVPMMAGVAAAASLSAVYLHDLQEQRARGRAQDIWYALDLGDDELTKTDVLALWELATSQQDVRIAFVRTMLESPILASRFAQKRQPIIRAMAGLDLETRALLCSEMEGRYANPDSSIRKAALIALDHLSCYSPNDAEGLIAQIQGTHDSESLSLLGEALASAVRSVETHESQVIFNRLFEAAVSNHSLGYDAFKTALGTVATIWFEYTPTSALENVLRLYSDAIKANSDHVLRSLNRMELGELRASTREVLLRALQGPMARRYIDEWFSSLAHRADSDTIAIADTLVTWSSFLNNEQLSLAKQYVIEAILRSKHLSNISALVKDLADVAPSISSDDTYKIISHAISVSECYNPCFDVADAFSDIFEALNKDMSVHTQQLMLSLALQHITQSEYHFQIFEEYGDILSSLSGAMTSGQLQEFLAICEKGFQEGMGDIFQDSWVGTYSEGVKTVVGALSEGQKNRAVDYLISKMDARDKKSLLTSAFLLKSIDITLTPSQIKAATLQILRLFNHDISTLDLMAVRGIGFLLGLLVGKLDTEHAAEITNAFLMAIDQTDNNFVMADLVSVMSRVPWPMPSEAVAKGVERVVRAITQDYLDESEFKKLAEALEDVAAILSSDQAQVLITELGALMEKDPTIRGERDLAKVFHYIELRDAYAALTKRLSQEQLLWGITTLVNHIKATCDNRIPPNLTYALETTSDKADEKQIPIVLKFHVDALKEAIKCLDYGSFSSVEVLASNMTKFSSAQQSRQTGVPEQLLSEALQKIISYIRKPTDRQIPDQQPEAARVIVALVPFMSQRHAGDSVAAILAGVAETANGDALSAYVSALEVLVQHISREEALTAFHSLRDFIAWAGTRNLVTKGTEAIVALLKAHVGLVPSDEIINILKYPTVAGTPTEMLFNAIPEIFSGSPRYEGDDLLFEIMTYANTNWPAIASEMPIRPERPFPELAK